MRTPTENDLSNIEFHLRYEDEHAVHNQYYLAYRVNLWRDILPDKLAEHLLVQRKPGKIQMVFPHGEIVPEYDKQLRKSLKSNQFGNKTPAGYFVDPRYGRFYPKGVLRDITGVFSQNISPFRCVNIDDASLVAELNHPLAKKDLHLSCEIKKVIPKIDERGGTTVDWGEVITDGPGMQSRVNGCPTDFFSPDAFSRLDETPDTLFYSKPRFVHHLDRVARGHIQSLYGRLVPPGARVLDLMSSWVSHLPENIETVSVTGVGLNDSEMSTNPMLTEHLVHDLNKDPIMPFSANSFDAAICTASIEYLTWPMSVLQEMGRVLKKGAPFVVTFSNRWFPPKAIKIWTELLEFERMGLVMEYFLASGQFTNLETTVIRGYPRPIDDKYFPQKRLSDPVFAVYGVKR